MFLTFLERPTWSLPLALEILETHSFFETTTSNRIDFLCETSISLVRSPTHGDALLSSFRMPFQDIAHGSNLSHLESNPNFLNNCKAIVHVFRNASVAIGVFKGRRFPRLPDEDVPSWMHVP